MQTAFIIILAILVVTLSVLLYNRIRREQRERTALAQIDLGELSRLVRTPIGEGSIKKVTGYVSEMLRNSCECRRIVLLKREGAELVPGDCFGLGDFDPQALKLTNGDDLEKELAGHPLPSPVDRLTDMISESAMVALDQLGCDMFFPVFWQDRLYGLYFVMSNNILRSPSFRIAITSLAQMLSAVHHVKWQEDRYDQLRDRVSTLEAESQKDETDPAVPSNGIFRLIRHRNSETLVGHIIEEVRKDLDLERCAFFYPSKTDDEPVQVQWCGSGAQIETPRRKMFEQLMSRLDVERADQLAALGKADASLAELAEGLSQAGLEYATAFPLSTVRTGLLAWNDPRAPQEILSGLRRHRLSVSELMANAESFEEVEGLSYTDNLTGLANRRYFMKRLEEEIGRARRYRRSLALIIFDLDELKNTNDRYGHQAGDLVLKQMGAVLKSSVRSIDVVARYGGDEFCIIMPESDRATCTRFMRRLQLKIAGAKFDLGQIDREINCTVSQGGAVFPDHAEDLEQLIYAADMALLKAKESGRDQFIVR